MGSVLKLVVLKFSAIDMLKFKTGKLTKLASHTQQSHT